MSTWIFQGNPTKFNVDDYLLENETIWWSIRQEHLAEHIKLNDEVFIWRSDGGDKGSGGIVARTKVISLPQDYTNDSSAEYWYEDVSGDTYLAVELEVLEVEIEELLKRTVLLQDSVLKELPILKMRNSTNYLLEENVEEKLKNAWAELFSKANMNDEIVKELKSRFHQAMMNITEETKKFGYNPTRFKKMLLADGGYIVAKKLLSSKTVSDGFSVLWENQALDLSVEAVVLQKQFRLLFTHEELETAKNRLSEFGYEIVDTGFTYDLPILNSNGRVREYNYYSDELKGQVIYEHLINNKTHRWMDINILGRDGNTNGRDSANILYYLGMRADYRGTFEGKSLDELFEVLQTKGEEYVDIKRLLKIYGKSKELYEIVKSDIDAAQAEEGNRLEGTKKSYFVNKYERDPKNRKKAIEIHGVKCCACSFDFEEVYGERGTDFIEVHHIKPLSTLEEAVEINPETDLVPLCANCHRMVHRRKDDVLTIDELKRLINSK